MAGLWPAMGQNNMHYSQFYNSPMFLNPALTGQLGEDLFRLNAHRRQQWSGVESSNSEYLYVTTYGGVDLSLFKKRLGVGLGANLDQAGGIFSTMNITPSLSYSFIMGDNILTFGGQYVYNQTSFSHPNPNPPIAAAPNTSYSDANAGVNLKLDLFYITSNLGFSVEHLLRPNQQFIGNTAPNRLPMFFKTHANFDWDLTEKLKVLPGFFGGFLANSTDLVFGSNVSYKIIDGGVHGNRLIGGLWFRTNNGNIESIIPKFGMRMNKMQIMASYDYNMSVSKGGNSNYFQGLTNTFEISIIFTGKPKVVPPLFEDDFILNPRY